ncbi:cell-envelope stress modulator CpxP [Enterobacteriaceae bacterium LUAb1]
MRGLAVIIASAFTLNFSALANDVIAIDELHQTRECLQRSMEQNPESCMFDDIKLTEQQRQQMRDLMRSVRYKGYNVYSGEIEKLHHLIIADKFDDTAVREQMKKLADIRLNWQVETARVRNQMYHLLVPEQQAVLNKRHELRMNELYKLSGVSPKLPLHAVNNVSKH